MLGYHNGESVCKPHGKAYYEKGQGGHISHRRKSVVPKPLAHNCGIGNCIKLLEHICKEHREKEIKYKLTGISRSKVIGLCHSFSSKKSGCIRV